MSRGAWASGWRPRGAVGIILGQLARQANLITDQLLVAIVIMALATSLIAGPAMQAELRLKTQRKLHDPLSDRHILLDPPAHGVHEVFHGLSQRAAEVTAVTDPKLIFREV